MAETVSVPAYRTEWHAPLPHFSITIRWSTSTDRGSHESLYEVVSRNELSPDAIGRLSEAGLLGIGQYYKVLTSEPFTVEAQPVAVSLNTGKVLEGVTPTDWSGEPMTKTHSYTYYRYEIRRVCDSGD